MLNDRTTPIPSVLVEDSGRESLTLGSTWRLDLRAVIRAQVEPSVHLAYPNLRSTKGRHGPVRMGLDTVRFRATPARNTSGVAVAAAAMAARSSPLLVCTPFASGELTDRFSTLILLAAYRRALAAVGAESFRDAALGSVISLWLGSVCGCRLHFFRDGLGKRDGLGEIHANGGAMSTHPLPIL